MDRLSHQQLLAAKPLNKIDELTQIESNYNISTIGLSSMRRSKFGPMTNSLVSLLRLGIDSSDHALITSQCSPHIPINCPWANTSCKKKIKACFWKRVCPTEQAT